MQLIFGGKAHPHDHGGKEIIQHIHRARASLPNYITVAYVPDYDMAAARLMAAGCDLWLSTPQPPLEASGTSGMKAAVNGVPSLGVLDGWWIEGCLEGVTGWGIESQGPLGGLPAGHNHESRQLYEKLEHLIMPMYYREPDAYINVMRHAIAVNGSFFNTERMLSQYVTKAYFE